MAWETCFAVRARVVSVCDLPQTYAVHMDGGIVGVYPRLGRDVWKGGVVVKEWPDKPLLTLTLDCPNVQQKREPTTVTLRCAKG